MTGPTLPAHPLLSNFSLEVVLTDEIGALTQPETIATAKAFESNLHNLDGMLRLPLLVSNLATEDVMVRLETMMSVAGGGPLLLAIPNEVYEARREKLRGNATATQRIERLSELLLVGWLRNPKFESYLVSLLRSGITLAWTAYETMVSDLWRAIFNASPNVLARRRKDLENALKEGSGLSIDLVTLAKHQFNISHVIGDVIADRFDFSGLDHCRHIYEATFGELKEDRDKVKSLFGDRGLRRLEAARNLIVHRGGIVDAKYVDKSGDGTAVVGQPLPVDSQIISDYANGCIKASVALFAFIDRWLELFRAGR